ncbi:MAG: transcriptional repressor, partial [Gammaproteobacteria bacterium]
FLVAQGLVHKLASINAYMGCPQPETVHRGCFLICRECQTAREIQPTLLDDALAHASTVEGFDISSATLEVSGLCQNCRQARRT